ncbi:MAG TPA: hypothetical protein VEZ90_04995 [Blastocatellia bacterium]|nr:hypothetical protein [Blastocatellia bacterium]
MITPQNVVEARFKIAVEGNLVETVNANATADWPSDLMLAIGSRETGFLWEQHWNRQHDWAILGDSNHGHGVWQIDDRSHADFTSTNAWKDPARCCLKAIEILNQTRAVLTKDPDYQALNADTQLKAVIAAYNCGPGNEEKALRRHLDPDAFDFGHNYAEDVLEQRPIFAELLNAPQEKV